MSDKWREAGWEPVLPPKYWGSWRIWWNETKKQYGYLITSNGPMSRLPPGAELTSIQR
jgi:hypothetical protein